MSSREATRSFGLCGALGLVLAAVAAAADPPGATLVEHESRWWPKGQGGSLGTTVYVSSQQEHPFFERLSADEVTTGSQAVLYDLATRDKKYVGWYGIVREISEEINANRTVLTIEHKYFDGRGMASPLSPLL